ncbi:unnamed protein product [Sphagnum tenellum]
MLDGESPIALNHDPKFAHLFASGYEFRQFGDQHTMAHIMCWVGHFQSVNLARKNDFVTGGDWKRAIDLLSPKLKSAEEAFRHARAMESLKKARAMKLKHHAEEWDRDRPNAALAAILQELHNLELASKEAQTLMDEPYLALAIIAQALEGALAKTKDQIEAYKIGDKVNEAAKQLQN